MGGCLGPKQRRQQVYIQIIQTIHQQVTQMTFQQAQNLDIYEYLKQKLTKKGLLRRLVDNLISHRNKIYDSLNHNYQIVLQSPKLQNKYVGLLIFDQIISGIYRSISQNQKTNNGNSYESQDYTNMSNNIRSDMYEANQMFLSKQKMSKSKHLQYVMQVNSMFRQIDARFDIIYFKLIIYLSQNIPKMYIRILKSLNNYCLHKKNKFNCTDLIWQVLNSIIQKIKKDVYKKQNTYTYNLLLQNTKQNFKQYQNKEDIKEFIKIWINQKQKFNNSFASKSSKVVINAEQEQSTFDTEDTQELRINAIKIISLYFHNNITSWNSQFLYDILLDIYDQKEFQLAKIGQLESVIYSIVLKNDLHVHFFRGLFVELLEYLSFKSNIRNSRTSGFINPEEPKRINSSKKNVKFNGIKTLRRWAMKKYIDLNQTVAYNCGLLVSSYLQNLIPSDSQQNNKILKQFLKLVRQNMVAKSKQIVVSSLIQHIKEGQTDFRIRSLIISLMRQLLQDKEILYHFGEDFDYIITLDEHFSQQNQMQLLQLMGFIVKLLSDSYFSQSSDFNSSQIINFKHKICDFLYTSYEVIVYGSADQHFKYRFSCAIISFLRAIQMKSNISIIYSFYLQLLKSLKTPNQQSNSKKQKNAQLSTQKDPKRYFILYLCYEISHILVDYLKIPTTFRILNEKISQNNKSPSKISKNMKNQVVLTIQQIIRQDRYIQPNLIDQQFRIHQIESQIHKYKLFNSQNFQSTRKIMRNYFSTDRINGFCKRNFVRKQQNQDANSVNLNSSFGGSVTGNKNTSNNPFGRRDSIYYQSQNGSYRGEDKNLKDVLNMLNT